MPFRNDDKISEPPDALEVGGARLCPSCSQPNNCAVAGELVAACWCYDVNIRAESRHIVERYINCGRCHCRACLVGETA